MDAQTIIKTYSLDKKRWVHKGAHAVLHTMYPVAVCLLKPLKQYWGDAMNLFVLFVIEDYLYWYYNEEDMTRLRILVVDKLNNDPNFLKNHEKAWKKSELIFLKACKKIDSVKLSDLSDDKLLSLYKELFDAYVEEYAISMGLLESFSMQVDSFFRPILEEFLRTKTKKYDLNEVFTLLLSPVDESFINLEFRSRLHIIKAIHEKKPENKISKMLEEHAKRFFWVENNYAKIKALNADYFREKIMNEIKLGIDPDAELKKMESYAAKTRKDKQEMIKELGLPKELQNIVRATEVFARMQDERKKCVLISNHYQKQFMNEIGKRCNLNEAQMNYTVFPEMTSILARSPSKEYIQKLKDRKKASLCIAALDDKEDCKVFEGDAALEVFNNVFNPKIEDKEIKGICASPGKVTGIVKIVRKTHDLASVNKGDILVASMTRPEMVVAMEKASGIITDEGGVTCHAAIVSRELGIPCIIGTKIATKVLKNGDLIELDADNGIVRIIK